ncbi:MAG: hypothetical protein GPJ54_13950 [Candidatus Heimdallarchaeota archaeon]|nr:hypothetical protein [Candidatus Heimdallarchaeota archaeon]
MKQKKIFGLALIFVFVLSMSANTNIVVAQTDYVATNFDLSFFIPTGSRRDESYSLYIKQALAPLGIEVNIFAKPWGQYVGDLTHLVPGSGKPWDISTVGFSGGGPTPDFGWFYRGGSFWGDYVMQLSDPDVIASQLAQTGLEQDDVNAMIDAIDFELNITKRYELLEEFNDLYFTKLLWNMPLAAQTYMTAMWEGFGGENSADWNTKEGILGSSWLGAAWEDAFIPAQRAQDLVTYRTAVGDQGQFNLDPFQVVDTSQATQSNIANIGGFAVSDQFNNIHPNTAWNYFVTDGGTIDDDDNTTTAEVASTQYTFLLRDDVVWPATTDMDGAVVPAHQLDANDYNLTLTMYDMDKQTTAFKVNGIDTWKVLYDWDVSTTVWTDDTLTFRLPNDLRTPDDLLWFTGLTPLPDHILGGDLTWLNKTTGETDVNMTSPLVPGMPFSPWNTFEWNHYESFEGNTAIGPYMMSDYEFNVFHSFVNNPDYWFPNEWDTVAYREAAGLDAEVVALESDYSVNLTRWGGLIEQDAYYHTWAEVAGNKAKPATPTLEKYQYVVIADQNAELIKFEAGDLDDYGSSQLGAAVVSAHTADADMVVKQEFPSVSARMLFFNMLHPDLLKLNVRLAITHAIDRDKLVSIHDGFGSAWWSVAFMNKESAYEGDIYYWDDIQHELAYDYSLARDLMRLEGYQAAETNDFIPTAAIPDVAEIVDILGVEILTEVVGSELLMLFSSFAMISVVLIRKRK